MHGAAFSPATVSDWSVHPPADPGLKKSGFSPTALGRNMQKRLGDATYSGSIHPLEAVRLDDQPISIRLDSHNKMAFCQNDTKFTLMLEVKQLLSQFSDCKILDKLVKTELFSISSHVCLCVCVSVHLGVSVSECGCECAPSCFAGFLALYPHPPFRLHLPWFLPLWRTPERPCFPRETR